MNRRSLATVFTSRTAGTVRLTRDANRRTYSAGREWTGTVAQCTCGASHSNVKLTQTLILTGLLLAEYLTYFRLKLSLILDKVIYSEICQGR